MEIKAYLRNAGVGCQKARILADLVRGKDVNEAIRILTFMPQKPAAMLKKLIESAVANAEQKKVVDVDNLYVKHVSVDMGASLSRFRPRAQGRATPIRRKSSHFNLVLDER
ncbi:MAG: 50S ribosomal protein L22 [Bdellovibrionaceae bacterium]|nr:50S ribosomal protein L22 [Pseudobdellovibrionaceae bacterium]